MPHSESREDQRVRGTSLEMPGVHQWWWLSIIAHPPQHTPPGKNRENTEPSEQTQTLLLEGSCREDLSSARKGKKVTSPTPTPLLSLCPEEYAPTTHDLPPPPKGVEYNGKLYFQLIVFLSYTVHWDADASNLQGTISSWASFSTHQLRGSVPYMPSSTCYHRPARGFDKSPLVHKDQNH